MLNYYYYYYFSAKKKKHQLNKCAATLKKAKLDRFCTKYVLLVIARKTTLGNPRSESSPKAICRQYFSQICW